MSLLLRYPWKQQPQAPVTVSPAYPNARVWLPSLGPFSIGGNSQITQSAFGALKPSRLGVTYEHTGADFNNGWTLPAAAATSGCALVVVLAKAASGGSLIANATNDTLSGQSGGVASLATFAATRCTGTLLVGDGSVIVAQSKTSDHALAHRTSNGAIEIIRSATGSGGNWATATNLCRYANTGIALIAQIPNTSLSDAALLRLLNDPWGELLVPPQQKVFNVATAASGNTIAVPAGNIVLTGYIPTIVTTANQIVAVPAGGLVLTGQTPTIVSTDNKTISVPAGSIIFTGNAPAVVASGNNLISVPVGSIVLVGYAPTVVASSGGTVTIKAGSWIRYRIIT